MLIYKILKFVYDQIWCITKLISLSINTLLKKVLGLKKVMRSQEKLLKDPFQNCGCLICLQYIACIWKITEELTYFCQTFNVCLKENKFLLFFERLVEARPLLISYLLRKICSSNRNSELSLVLFSCVETCSLGSKLTNVELFDARRATTIAFVSADLARISELIAASPSWTTNCNVWHNNSLIL